MSNLEINGLILGLDLGTTSIGWSLINEEEKKIIKMGVRIFDEGVNRDPSGKESTKNAQRRDARSARRMRERRYMRTQKLFKLLQKYDLLPKYSNEQLKEIENVTYTKQAKKKEQRRLQLCFRNKIIENLDKELISKWEKILPHRPELYKKYSKSLHLIFPFFLRTIALSEKLERYELGRAIFHLSHRRGFLSNRKSGKGKEDGDVLKSINKLFDDINIHQYRTIGELFSTFDPEKIRIRKRYTSRIMFVDEFNKIINSQIERLNQVVPDEIGIKSIYKSIFYQRPLKPVRKFIGFCSLEKNKRRMKISFLNAQEFRVRQTLNNIVIFNDSLERRLSKEETEILYQYLLENEKLKLSLAKKIIRLSPKEKFKYEDNEIKGNTTSANISKIYKDFLSFNEKDKEKFVNSLISFDSEKHLTTHLVNKWNIKEEIASKLAEITFEEGYLSYSSRAVNRLLPMLREGLDLHNSKLAVGYKEKSNINIFNFLPSYETVDPSLRNPIVSRALSELRKVVNGLIKIYGKPKQIRVELARELKKGKKYRENILKENKSRRSDREKAIAEINKFNPALKVSNRDIEKLLLFNECGKQCPYTGRSISMEDLFGSNPLYDVEHIIPLSRCLDDSFLNKTLCFHYENRHVKKNRTPYESYGLNNPEKYNEILKRVEKFSGKGKYRKLELFKKKISTSEEDFTTQMLNDTRYITKLAKGFLGLLYGGEVDPNHILRIRASTGQVTSYLRNMWKLNSILSESNFKSRDDHRHHAIDALVIALTTENSIKLLNIASKNSYLEGKNKFGKINQVWDDLYEQTNEHVSCIKISYRVEKKINGSLHKESFYGKNKDKIENTEYYTIRKPINSLSKNELNSIIDPYIKNAVIEKLDSSGTSDVRKAFDLEKIETLPYIEVKHNKQENRPYAKNKGEKIFIKSVRIRVKYVNNLEIGKGIQQRAVQPDENHHISYYLFEKNNGTLWKSEVTSRLQAVLRKQNNLPVINKEVMKEHGGKFLFSLVKGDTIEVSEGDKIKYWNVKSILSDGRIYYSPVNDARTQQIREENNAYLRVSARSLQSLRCRKVIISPIGEIYECSE
ncbi:type II CRISPR RNA-guided endonuclease Cas9 [Pigmentibacter sp. JX0631]|uniref:type II CRISPR RNA-guided endonuclease Cas9 n=1 Tax=Pigmentibacter sp. JX0631 TaxID=2976982 RepID=UPI0024697473|nr:type II CRISPR RNA-guided endonuclease Cas9 [Pigmentibacter sp. JX0631]WGL60087.1 type II CRISPR RNA-guided endonuclease Cas9 [Pigmentibacter sp. JX0631]